MQKLEILGTIRRAYGTTFNPALWLRGTLTWAGVFVVFAIINMLVARQLMPDLALAPRSPPSAGLFISALVMIATFFLTHAGIAVNVHRYILLGEKPHLLRVSRLEGAYMWRSVKLGFRFAIAVWVVEFGGLLLGGLLYILMNGVGAVIAIFAAIIVALDVAARIIPYLLVLPSVAIGNYDFYFADAMALGRNQRWRILGTFVGCLSPLMLIFVILVAAPIVAAGDYSSPEAIANALRTHSVMSTVINIVEWPLQVVLMILPPACAAHIYRALVQQPGEPSTESEVAPAIL